MAATDAKPVPQKNVAYRHYFWLRDNTGALITSWTGADTELSGDGGAFADATNEAIEVGGGYGYIDLTAAEMNYDAVGIKIIVTNANSIAYGVTLFPEETGDIRVNATAISDDATAANNLELDYDGTGYSKANSTIGTCTTNTDMRGTDNAALDATGAKEATLTARTLAAADYFDPATDTVANVTLVATTTTNTDMRGTDNALLASSAPTNFGDLAITTPAGEVTAENMRGTDNAALDATAAKEATLTARTLASADYFDPAADTVARVTLVDTTTANTDMRGTDSAALATDLTTLQADVTVIRGYEAGDWEIVSNQMIFKNEAGTEIARYNLTKAGVPDSDAPDKREKV